MPMPMVRPCDLHTLTLLHEAGSTCSATRAHAAHPIASAGVAGLCAFAAGKGGEAENAASSVAPRSSEQAGIAELSVLPGGEDRSVGVTRVSVAHSEGELDGMTTTASWCVSLSDVRS